MFRKTTSFAFTACLLSACGGSTLPSARMPVAEAPLVRILPNDAYVVARVDATALRRLPQWPALSARLRAEDEQLAEAVTGLDVAYVAVGGLMDPGPSGGATPDGEYQPRPSWGEISDGFGGRLPKMVFAFRGEATSLCRTLLLTAETHDVGGFRAAYNGGTAVAVADDVCVVTFEPVLRELVAESAGTAPVVGRLVANAPGGRIGVLSAAVELDAPAFRAMLGAIGPRPDRSENAAREGELVRRIVEIPLRGIASVEWQIDHGQGGYASRVRVQANDLDRGVMWRELTEMYLEIARAVSESLAHDSENAQHIADLLEDVGVEPRDDGFVSTWSIEESTVLRLIEASQANAADGITLHEADSEPLTSTMNARPSDFVASAEPRLSELAGLEPYQRHDVRSELARAYAALGRYDDARRVFAEEATEFTETSEYPHFHVAAHRELCELELALGRTAEARAAGEVALATCANNGCSSHELASATSCVATATAMDGDVPTALERIDTAPAAASEAAVTLELGRARVLSLAGRGAEAAAIARSACAGRQYEPSCLPVALFACEHGSRSATTVADGVAACNAAFNLSGVTERETLVMRAALDTAICAMHARLGSQDAESLCTEARASALERGERDTVALVEIDVALARVFAATRQTAKATEADARARAGLARLGQRHRLRGETGAATGATGATGPARGRRAR